MTNGAPQDRSLEVASFTVQYRTIILDTVGSARLYGQLKFGISNRVEGAVYRSCVNRLDALRR